MNDQNMSTVLKDGTHRMLVGVFVLSSLISALLLFFIQPMFTKMALPFLGGSPGVWNTAMVFFQAVLLAGYLYTFLLTKFLALRWQVIIQTAVLALGLIFLPIAIPQSWQLPDVSGTPSLWIIGLFSVALGAPFFALSAHAPLLQRWFSYTSHPNADDPYFLYAASNLGSLFSLLSYPVLIEPLLPLSSQSGAWAVGYLLLAGLVILSGFAAHKHLSGSQVSASKDKTKVLTELSIKRRLYWIVCAIIPSGLMLAVTAQISANVASAPFIWVVPLALYLLTFILVFSRKTFLPQSLLLGIFPFLALIIFISLYFSIIPWGAEIAIHLLGFFVISMLCHGQLAETRPPADRLTEFYLLMSLGGVLGGASVALLAPVLFNDILEYPALVLSVVFVLPTVARSRKLWVRDLIMAGIIILVLFLYFVFLEHLGEKTSGIVGIWLTFGLLGLAYFGRNQRLKTVIGLFALWALIFNSRVVLDQNTDLILKERSFFGVFQVREKTSDHGPVHTFTHGNTLHNQQLQTPEGLDYPLAYYAPDGSFGQVIKAVRENQDDMSVAAIGLGAGALACHTKPDEDWLFYEIDPAVVKMARNPKYFSFIETCNPDVPVELGDARLTLERQPDRKFDLIIVDAFSSDSIPTHLISVEAVELYLSRLKPGGVVFFHTSNRYLNVAAVIVNVANHKGLSHRYLFYEADESETYSSLLTQSGGVVIGAETDLKALPRIFSEWRQLDPVPSVGVWTDDFSHILGAMRAKKNESLKDK